MTHVDYIYNVDSVVVDAVMSPAALQIAVNRL